MSVEQLLADLKAAKRRIIIATTEAERQAGVQAVREAKARLFARLEGSDPRAPPPSVPSPLLPVPRTVRRLRPVDARPVFRTGETVAHIDPSTGTVLRTGGVIVSAAEGTREFVRLQTELLRTNKFLYGRERVVQVNTLTGEVQKHGRIVGFDYERGIRRRDDPAWYQVKYDDGCSETIESQTSLYPERVVLGASSYLVQWFNTGELETWPSASLYAESELSSNINNSSSEKQLVKATARMRVN